MPWVLPTNGIDTLLTITNYRDYTTGRGGDTLRGGNNHVAGPIELIIGNWIDCRILSGNFFAGVVANGGWSWLMLDISWHACSFCLSLDAILLLLLLFQCVLQTRLSAQSIFRQSMSLKFCASKDVRTCGKLIHGKMCRILCLLVHPQNKGYRRTMARTRRKYTFSGKNLFPATSSQQFRVFQTGFFPCKE